MDENDSAAAASALDTSMLLPPTYFTVPTPRASSHDPLWTRSALQEELERLRAEIVDIRHRRPESSMLPEPGPQAGSSNVSVLNEILTQQTAELSRMRAEIDNMRGNHSREIADLKELIESHERQIIEKEEAFENRLRHVVDEYESSLNDKDIQTSELVKQQEAERLSWESQSRNCNMRFDKDLSKKEAIIQNLSHSNDELQIEISKLKSELTSALEQVEKLKLCESWAVERPEVMLRIQDLERQLQTSASTNDLKQQRLDAIQNILTIQENELAKYEMSENQQAISSLLGRWREKVFAMMVQTESTRFAYAKDIQNYRLSNRDLERQLERARSVATTNELKVMACHAEIQDAKENFQQTSQQLVEARQALETVTVQRDSLNTSLTSLRTSVESLVRGMAAQEREMLSKTLTAMNTLDRRLKNVSDRLPVLKAHIKRLRAKEAVTQLREEYEGRFHRLQQELEVVRADRDRLAKQMETDAEETGDRERNLRQEYETEIRFLAKKCDSLLEEVDKKSKRLDIVEAELADLQMCSSAIQEDNDELRAKLDAVEESRREDVRITTTQLYEEHSQQMSLLQSTLDDVRREHTTTVVALRQAERDLERIRQEHSLELSALREQHEMRLSELQKVISNLEKERNLLRATVRQEGLLRAPAVPKVSSSYSPGSLEMQQDGGAGTHRKAAGEFGPHLANLIEEVRSLVRSVEASEDFDVSDNDE